MIAVVGVVVLLVVVLAGAVFVQAKRGNGSGGRCSGTTRSQGRGGSP